VPACLILAPFTFGISLGVGVAIAVSTTNGVIDQIEKIRNGEFGKVNNGKGSTIYLRDEMKEANDRLSTKQDYETERYETRIEVVPEISISECVIM